jgi:oxygen-independent coproporphyrinogen-3 oxidase
LLDAEEITAILGKATQRYGISSDAEITLEANPDDITPEKAASWLKAGINRLSIGIQSFHENDLVWMNRAHTAIQALESIEVIRRAGFTNFSIDLIFGLPGLDDADWQENLDRSIAMGIPHISAYALTVEEGTALNTLIRKKKLPDVDPGQQASQFLQLVDTLENSGYLQYEISNFALPGCQSRHNSSYWQGIPYLGFGPSAHSFDGVSRRWNISHNPGYIQALKQHSIPSTTEILTPVQKLNEYIMTGLRTSDGISLTKLEKDWDRQAALTILNKSAEWQEKGYLTQAVEILKLTRNGKLFADGIAASLFFDEPVPGDFSAHYRV